MMPYGFARGTSCRNVYPNTTCIGMSAIRLHRIGENDVAVISSDCCVTMSGSARGK